MPVKLARTLVLAALMLSQFGGGRAAATSRQPCQPHPSATYRYSSTSFRFVFAIRLCDDRGSIGFGAEGTRTQASGLGTGAAIDGVAGCVHRLCTVTFGFQHERELARYAGDIIWGGVATDSLSPLVCGTTGSLSGCRQSGQPA
jgi:hypothetical protein